MKNPFGVSNLNIQYGYNDIDLNFQILWPLDLKYFT